MQSELLSPIRWSPAASGFSMPAEWEPHEGTWLVWPHSTETWKNRIEAAQTAIIYFIQALHLGERIHLVVSDVEAQHNVTAQFAALGLLGNVVFHIAPTDCEWIRDFGGVFLRQPETGEVVVIDWAFNNWGGKFTEQEAYPHLEWQNDLPRRMAEAHQAERIPLDFILEGGSLEVNGKGLLLTSEDCLLNPNRNPQYTQPEITQLLCDYLGIRKVLWLGKGLHNDETDGHIDNLARFVNDNTVLTVVEPDPQDVNHDVLKDNLERLKHMTDLTGNPLQIIELVMPDPVFEGSERMAASYANFYIGNAAIVMPGYGTPKDVLAKHTLQTCFPDRPVVVVPYNDLIVGGGSFHCLTQQVPIGMGAVGKSGLATVGW
ncbi:MAG: agmatine deiminase family protein [Bacteroidetes Order II. Incertae sedis bacterium]|nr:agmatine deiminase family protein [Bacteroidetes Order II. bacterium]